MTVPSFETFMLPILELLKEGDEIGRQQLIEATASKLDLTEEDRSEITPKGQIVYKGRISWGLTYLTQAGVLMRPRKGVYKITDRGRELLDEGLDQISHETLSRYEEYLDFYYRGTGGQQDQTQNAARVMTGSPEEVLESSYSVLRAELAAQILESLKVVDPTRFEVIVVDVLEAMGYGGGRAGAARAVGQVGDGGIDGVIDEDRLGLDSVYVQAKRWQDNVGRPLVQAFVGAIQGKANKGVMITTSDFTADAKSYVEGLPTRIVLIGGERLAELMIDYDVGVSSESTYVLKRLDSDYFEE